MKIEGVGVYTVWNVPGGIMLEMSLDINQGFKRIYDLHDIPNLNLQNTSICPFVDVT